MVRKCGVIGWVLLFRTERICWKVDPERARGSKLKVSGAERVPASRSTSNTLAAMRGGSSFETSSRDSMFATPPAHTAAVMVKVRAPTSSSFGVPRSVRVSSSDDSHTGEPMRVCCSFSGSGWKVVAASWNWKSSPTLATGGICALREKLTSDAPAATIALTAGGTNSINRSLFQV